MSFDPTSVISLIQNCKTLYDYFADVKHSSKERRRLLDEVRALQPELEALQRLASTRGDAASMDRLGQLLDPAQPFAKVVDETLGRVKDVLTYGTSDPKANRFKVLGKRGAAALWWPVNKAEVKDLLIDLERYKTRIGLALQHDMFKKQDVMGGKLDVVDGKQDVIDGKLVAMSEKQEVVAKHLSDETRLKMAQFISQNDYGGHRVDLSEQRLAGTGNWMLQHPDFVAWRDNKESPTLWCYGHPGAGKSVMAAFLVDHLQSTPENIVLSVFCRYSSNDFTTPFPVLRGLLRQLIERSTRVPTIICEQYWKGIHPTPDDLPAFLVQAAAVHTRPVYIVLDALDECKITLDLLCAIQQLGPSFRLLVTSRPVFEEIKQYPSIKIRPSDQDILVAVDATLPKLKFAWLDDTLKRTIRAKIVEKADGMFLLASLQLRELERDVTRPRDVTAILDSLPRTLDDAYELTFQRIRQQGARKKELACRALALTVLLASSLDFEQMQHLLAEGDVTQYTDPETLLQCCYGLVRRDTYGSMSFAFIHYSVHEYITAHWPTLFPENPNPSHLCLELGYSVFVNPIDESGLKVSCWTDTINAMRKPEELDLIISLLSSPEYTASIVKSYTELVTPLVYDLLLVACFCGYRSVAKYMIETAPRDVQRFSEVLRVCKSFPWINTALCVEWINARGDVRVQRSLVVVDVDLNGI